MKDDWFVEKKLKTIEKVYQELSDLKHLAGLYPFKESWSEISKHKYLISKEI